MEGLVKAGVGAGRSWNEYSRREVEER